MARPAAATGHGPIRSEALLWALLVAAFSPVLVDLASHLAAEPWSVYVLAFVVLFVAESRRAGYGEARPRLAFGLILAGLVLELVMVRAGWPRMARPGWVAAAFGLTQLVGRPAPWRATLLLWWIPVPQALLGLTHPLLAKALATPGALGAGALGADVTLGPIAGSELAARLGDGLADGALPLVPGDAGIPLAVSFAGLAWWAALARGREPVGALRSAVLAALCALPLQALVLASGIALGLWLSAGAGRVALDVSVGLATALGLAWAWRVAARPPAA